MIERVKSLRDKKELVILFKEVELTNTLGPLEGGSFHDVRLHRASWSRVDLNMCSVPACIAMVT